MPDAQDPRPTADYRVGYEMGVARPCSGKSSFIRAKLCELSIAPSASPGSHSSRVPGRRHTCSRSHSGAKRAFWLSGRGTGGKCARYSDWTTRPEKIGRRRQLWSRLVTSIKPRNPNFSPSLPLPDTWKDYGGISMDCRIM